MRFTGFGSLAASTLLGVIAVLFSAAVCAQGPIAAGEAWLDADFDDLPFAPIGTGGAAAGEPVDVTQALDADVVPSSFSLFSSPSLALERNQPNGQASTRFEFVDSSEAVDGVLFVEFKVLMPALDDLAVAIHGQGGNATDFGVLRFQPSGGIEFEHGLILPLRDYAVGEIVRVSLAYDFGADAIEIGIDGVAESRIASAGITGLADGVGAILFRRAPGAVGPVYIDDVTTRRVGHQQSLLFANFNGLDLGPLPTGDADQGLPMDIDANLVAMVVPSHPAFGASSRALSYRREVDDHNADSVDYGFIGDAEIVHGVVSVKLRVVVPDDFTATSFYLRERNSAANTFATIDFGGVASAPIHFRTAGTSVNFVGEYALGERVDLHIEIDLDQATAAFAIDGVLVIPPTVMALPDPMAALGRLLIVQDHTSLNEVIVDDVDVQWYLDEPPESGDRIFSDGFEGKPN
jgi:hypothetical protein